MLAMLHPTTSFSVARVFSNFFLCSVTSHASLQVCVAIHNMGERFLIPEFGHRVRPLDTDMNSLKQGRYAPRRSDATRHLFSFPLPQRASCAGSANGKSTVIGG